MSVSGRVIEGSEKSEKGVSKAGKEQTGLAGWLGKESCSSVSQA